MDVNNFSMHIILYAGNAKSHLHEALENARNGAFDQVDEKMKLANEEILEAHKLQTKFIKEDTKGELKHLPVLLVHAQDHLMTVMSEKGLIEEMIELYRGQSEINKKVNYLLQLNNVEEF